MMHGLRWCARKRVGCAESRARPCLADNLARPLRYQPEGTDLVIRNGGEFSNRPLYGGDTVFRVDC